MTGATGTRSRISWYGRLATSVSLTVWVFDIIRSVWPSGAALTTASVPMMAPAPGRFSITKGRFSASDRCWPTARA